MTDMTGTRCTCPAYLSDHRYPCPYATDEEALQHQVENLTAELAAAREEITEARRWGSEHHKMFEVCLDRARRAERERDAAREEIASEKEAHDVTLQVMSNAIHERDAARADCARLLGLLIDVHGDRQQCNVCLAWTDQPGQVIQHVSDCEVPSVLAAQAAPSDD